MYTQVDASQLEWRTAVELSRDKTGIEEILDKQDTHSLNEKAFNLPSRLIAKIYLFRTIFRGSGWAFANDPAFMHVSSSPQFWDEINEKFYAKYNGLDRKHKEWADLVMHGQLIEGPTRSWSINMARDGYGNLKIPWTILSNYPVQGTGADIMMLARISAYKRIKKYKIPCLFTSTVHDSIITDSEEKYCQDIAAIFTDVFADLQGNIKTAFQYDWLVPMSCECKIGPNMKDMRKMS